MAQLVQWGGAPAALARDTELRGHAKRGARGAPCTSLASFPPPSPRATRFSSPIYALRTRCTRFAHMQRPLRVVSLGTRPRENGSRPRTVPQPGCVCISARACASQFDESNLEKRKKNRNRSDVEILFVEIMANGFKERYYWSILILVNKERRDIEIKKKERR